MHWFCGFWCFFSWLIGFVELGFVVEGTSAEGSGNAAAVNYVPVALEENLGDVACAVRSLHTNSQFFMCS